MREARDDIYPRTAIVTRLSNSARPLSLFSCLLTMLVLLVFRGSGEESANRRNKSETKREKWTTSRAPFLRHAFYEAMRREFR